jgi:hypothetical protein
LPIFEIGKWLEIARATPMTDHLAQVLKSVHRLDPALNVWKPADSVF